MSDDKRGERETAECRWIDAAMQPPPQDGSHILVENDRGVFCVAWESHDIDFWHVWDGKFDPRPMRGSLPLRWFPVSALSAPCPPQPCQKCAGDPSFEAGALWAQRQYHENEASLRAELAAANERIKALEEGLKQISNNSNLLFGGSRILHGNADLPSPTGEFYRGYNAGIDSQHKHTSEIAAALIAEKEQRP